MTRFAATIAASVLFLTMAFGIATLAQKALGQIKSLNIADSNNPQWNLAQTEVEFLAFYSILVKINAGETAELPALRRWFDIFYSRMDTVSGGPIFQQLSKRPKLERCFESVALFLDKTAVLMDGQDTTLLSTIPDIAIEAEAIRAKVRDISNEGASVFSALSDQRRRSVSEILSNIFALTIALTLALIFGMFWLRRLNKFRRAQTAEVQQTRDRLQAMLNTSLDAILVVNRASICLEYNGAAAKIFGYTRAEVLGKNLAKLIIPPEVLEKHQEQMRQHLEQGSGSISGRLQIEARRKSGQVFPLEISIAKIMSREGEIFVSYMRDISDRREAEEKLTKARDDALAGERAKARFIAVMSHEMRTPLNGLLGSLDLLQSTPLDPKQAQFADMMQLSGRMLLHHVNDVLDISRLEGGSLATDFAPFDFEELVSAVLESQIAVARAKGLELSQINTSPTIGTINGSAIALRQVLLNLVSNAIKFTENGSVTVMAERLPDHQLRIIVRDTGVGIAAVDQTRIFDDFVTLDSSFGRKANGTGLGLGIARRVALAMGGTLSLQSIPNLGSSFWLDIPFIPAKKVKVEAKPPKQIHPKTKPAQMRILVIEDNHINRFILCEMLRAAGHIVTEAQDGLAGLEFANEQRFDMIFMDISMPKLDGIAATLRLRAGNGASANSPVIALTAHALDADRDLFLASGMNAVLIKPLDRKQLLAILQNPSAQMPLPKTQPILRDITLHNESLEDLVAVLGKKKMSSLLTRFLAEGDAALVQITQAFEIGDLAAARCAIHTFAGSSATFGAASLQQILAGMETDLDLGRTSSARAALPRLSVIWPQTRAEIAAWL